VPRRPDTPELTVESGQTKSTDLLARLDQLSPGHPSSRDHSSRPTPDSAWRQAVVGFEAEWRHHEERWPPRHPDARRHEVGADAERKLQLGCEKIQAAEEEITSSLLEVEAAEPGRYLAGFEFRLKDDTRILEKARQNMANKPDRSPDAALALIPDAVRYTFCYGMENYSFGVQDDVARLKAAGFEMLKFKNFWGDPEYRGINSQWSDEKSGQRFEVQFHTAFSFEAKQVTHGAYERLRTENVSDEEEGALEAFQRKVTARVPLPLGAFDVTEHS
jgi:hypothetical protein